MDCLNEETILGFIEGALAPEELAQVELHALACDGCQERLSAGFAAGADGTAGIGAGPLARGTAIDRYTVRTRVGQGGMGEVYAAYDPKLDRTVALKLLRPRAGGGTPNAEGRLVREAQAIARLSHPNVITVHDVGTHDGRLFLAMEYVEGQTLAVWLTERPRQRAEIVAAFLHAARGLAAAHAAGLVHRDFKPQNVMVGDDGAVRVTDFGLARRIDVPDPGEEPLDRGPSHPADVTLTKTGDVVGTPRYMAPEQLRGEAADARSDQFSFCVALYEALYGEHPFLARRRRYGEARMAELVAALRAGAVRAPHARTGVPFWLRELLLRGLAVAPAARWPSMDHLIAALSRGPTRIRRRLVLAAATAALTVVVAAGGAGRPAPQLEAHRSRPVASPAPRPATVAVAIASAPAGARVVRERDGATMGATPFHELWPTGAGVENLRVERGGYRSEPVIVPLDRGIDLTVTLAPVAVPEPPADAAPRARIRPPERRRPAKTIDVLLAPAEEQLGLGRIAEACALGQSAAARAPESPAVWEFLGRCYMRLPEPREARACYRRYLALAPADPSASFIRAIVEREGP